MRVILPEGTGYGVAVGRGVGVNVRVGVWVRVGDGVGVGVSELVWVAGGVGVVELVGLAAGVGVSGRLDVRERVGVCADILMPAGRVLDVGVPVAVTISASLIGAIDAAVATASGIEIGSVQPTTEASPAMTNKIKRRMVAPKESPGE